MNTRSNSKAKAVLAMAVAMGLTGSAMAGEKHWDHGQGRGRPYQDQVDFARVVDVDPIVTRVRVSRPEQQCWNEERPVYGGGGRTIARSTIVGGLVGAAVGHRIGVHEGVRDPGLVIGGSLIGAAIGNSIGVDRAERNGDVRQVGYQDVQHCNVAYRETWEERIDGYRVTYVYNGRYYTDRMPYDPGERVRINVDVRPEYRRD